LSIPLNNRKIQLGKYTPAREKYLKYLICKKINFKFFCQGYRKLLTDGNLVSFLIFRWRKRNIINDLWIGNLGSSGLKPVGVQVPLLVPFFIKSRK
jgi:hypothetical protein